MATAWNDFGNHVSGQASALLEFGNMVDNLRRAKQTSESEAEKRSEYYQQALHSAVLGILNLAGNITPPGGSSHKTNIANAGFVAWRLQQNVSKAIEEHNEGKVNINRFQNILADVYTLGGLAGTAKGSGSMPSAALPLAIAGDMITAKALETGDTGTMSTDDFYNFDNWKGFGYELLEDWSRWVYDWFPDDWNPWKELSRDGKVYVYDPSP